MQKPSKRQVWAGWFLPGRSNTKSSKYNFSHVFWIQKSNLTGLLLSCNSPNIKTFSQKSRFCSLSCSKQGLSPGTSRFIQAVCSFYINTLKERVNSQVINKYVFLPWFAPRNSLTFSKSKPCMPKIKTKKEVGEGGVGKNHKIPTMVQTRAKLT